MVRRNPYTGEESKQMRKVFESMPSFNKETDMILYKEYTKFLETSKFPITPEKAAAYQEFFRATRDHEFLSWEEISNYIKTQHDPAQLMKFYTVVLDKDKNGFISPEEFKFGIKILSRHDPDHFGDKGAMEFEKFLEEADTNKNLRLGSLRIMLLNLNQNRQFRSKQCNNYWYFIGFNKNYSDLIN